MKKKYKERAKLIKKFIELAEHLRDMNNFETIMAVISALNDSPIFRLNASKSAMNPRHLESLQSMDELMSAEGSYVKYRAKLQEALKANQPTIPYLGVYRRDLIYHYDAMSKTKDARGETVLDFKRYAQIHQILQEIQTLQQNAYTFVLDPIVAPLLKNLPQPPTGMDNDEYKNKVLWELSIQREPRGANKSDII